MNVVSSTPQPLSARFWLLRSDPDHRVDRLVLHENRSSGDRVRSLVYTALLPHPLAPCFYPGNLEFARRSRCPASTGAPSLATQTLLSSPSTARFEQAPVPNTRRP